MRASGLGLVSLMRLDGRKDIQSSLSREKKRLKTNIQTESHKHTYTRIHTNDAI